MKNIINTFRNWQHLSGYSNRVIINPNSKHLSIIEYTIDIYDFPELNNKKIMFFSDLHFGSQKINIKDCQDIVNKISPDWIAFGGDLITYACFQEDAFTFLNDVFSEYKHIPKIAVFGNWDRRRNKWYPDSKWYDAFNTVGFKLLVNENIEFPDINFYGIDDPRLGNPQIKKDYLSINKFNCIISHNVDTVIDTLNEIPNDFQRLYLCGHSHGGQIRLPFFGALVTSTKYWKLFEYGHYFQQQNKINLILTSGIGTTRLPFRIFCDPEIVVIKFTKPIKSQDKLI